MLIAYLNNVSERSILMLNDMISSEVYPGQIIKLPIPKDASKRVIKNTHKDMKKGSSAPSNVHKNTNNR